MSSRTPVFLVAGTHSGVGKTTASFTLMALLKQKGFRVQPFKLGPDFIDGGYHRLATGMDSINLDLWMMGWEEVAESFRRYSSFADVSVIEGMGALFDGKNGTVSGSSADIAARLEVPVILVADIWGMTVSTAALLQGFSRFDRKVKIAGIVLNRAGGKKHYEMVLRGLPSSLRDKVLGYLPSDEELQVPERHLGLRTLQENDQAANLKKAAIRLATKTLDIKKPIHLFSIRKRKPAAPTRKITRMPFKGIKIGIAQDKAFCFYYMENLKMLEEQGIRLVPFSPLSDRKLPRGLSGLYLGGGYPESFPEKLSANRSLRAEILREINKGMPVYAECGGLMYLAKSLTDFEGKSCPMVGAVPVRIKMEKKMMAIRYVEIKTSRATLLGPEGTVARGHEYHHSRIISDSHRGPKPYQVVSSTGEKFQEGFIFKNLLASYVHLHFKSNPAVPYAFAFKCWQHRLQSEN